MLDFNVILYYERSEVHEQESFISFVKLPDAEVSRKNHGVGLLFQNLKDALVRITQNSQYLQSPNFLYPYSF